MKQEAGKRDRDRRELLFVLLYGGIVAVCTGLATILILQSLGALVSALSEPLGIVPRTAMQVAEALGALKDADFRLPVVLTLVFALLGGCWINRLKRKWSKVSVAVVAVLLTFCFTLWFTEVNTIRFGDVVESLAGMEADGLRIPERQPDRTEVIVSDDSEAVAEDALWTVGYGACQIVEEDLEENPLYIAGYDSDRRTSQILDNHQLEVYKDVLEGWGTEPAYDYGQARAVWIDAGCGGTMLIGVDCVALSADYVARIRDELKILSEAHGCKSVNVYATHSHAMPDTLGLWGPLGIDGKDDAYMEKLVDAAVEAASRAFADSHTGELFYGSVATEEELLRDSRYPYVYDANLHQIRFRSEDGSGVRLLFYGAHAESMRGANKILSRDFPGVLCDLITAQTGDDAMFLPGAIGGLIMTEELTVPFDAVENMQLTGRILADYALSITPESEEKLSPSLSVARTEITVPLDNNAFLYYQFLGILKCNAVKGESRTGYAVRSEMSLIRLGNVAIGLIPGEIFPELVYGGKYGFAASENSNPEPLAETAASYGVEHLLILGLANDELGYIVPPSDFLVHKTNPYLQKTMDMLGENHYEETNSVGPECANVIAEGFERLVKAGSQPAVK